LPRLGGRWAEPRRRPGAHLPGGSVRRRGALRRQTGEGATNGIGQWHLIFRRRGLVGEPWVLPRSKKGCGMAESRLHQLSGRGQSVWIDFLSRDLVQSGELKRMMKEDAVVGVTSNPTIFQKAISQGNAYDAQLKELLEDEQDPKEIFLHLAVRD